MNDYELTSGSTFHSAGLVGQLRSDVNLTRMIQYSTDLYRQLKDETGVEPDWCEVGSLRLASLPERMEELRRLTALSHSFGLPLELIGPKEAQDLFPVMTLTDVLGAVYLPTDGYIDPNGLTMALAAGAKSRGARFLTHTRVQGIELMNGRIHKVITDQGNIETEIVVNATGPWAGEIARMVGVYLLIIPMEHEYILTKPIAGQPSGLPTMRDPDWLIYYREEVGGLLMGGYERNPFPWSLKGIPADFNNKLLAADWDRFMPIIENAIRRTPQLETAEIIQMINGPEAFTPDSEFLLGPTDVPGFWVAAGFCAHGLASAGGTGKVMAEWIIDSWLKKMAEIETAVSILTPPAFCHNDLLNGNFLLDNGRVFLLDWEYAGMGDVFFDLANLAAHHEFDDEQELWLLTNYFGSASSLQQARLKLMKIMSDFREAMWGMVQIGISQLDFDFRGYANQHFDRMANSMYHPDYYHWLNEIQD
ncbi:MAG: FAD-dependent oxidoreductase [Chloroflexi bacterium]|nr:FAD-dependent oxidoreductase [Chloroflexota bacterium]